MLSIIGYWMIVLGVVSIYVQHSWFHHIRKYVMIFFLYGGLSLVTIGVRDNAELFAVMCMVTGTFFFIFVYVLITWLCKPVKRKVIEVLHLPAGSYEVATVDNPHSPKVQLKYLLKYEAQVYVLSSPPPKDLPALVLYAERIGNSDIVTVSFSVDKRSITLESVLRSMYTLLIIIAVMGIPVVWQIGDSDLRENMFGGFITLLFGYCCRKLFYGSKDLLVQCLYFFAVFCEVAAWFSILLVPFFGT